ncbi:hypothetical protein SAMN05216203_0467 [Marinobacter daqiaonensis]|uniref:Polysaccharide lyase n=1 Tax=Marinobacter daqiaonensis TaxID=650891 RepID=A0A1I6GTJ4_9GAMM|nr:hypothetical protein [Marinobacter daqiaonensis]SFR45593.1 hypothetical protein SAMN05216203_0467 [Marinobacter daqiaonensis]
MTVLRVHPFIPLALLLVSVTGARAADFAFEGTARDQQGEVIYQERHRVSGSCKEGSWRPGSQKVDYIRPDGDSPFAKKSLTYPDTLIRPEVDFRQPDFNETLEVTFGDQQEVARVEWSLGNGEAERWKLEVTPRLVVDAGFDHFIRANWDTLREGGSVEFRFLAPTRGEAYDFVAEPDPDPLDGARHAFRIKPSGFLMGMLVDPIRLGYDEQGFLTHYSGLGNIRRNQEENYVVDLRYRVTEPADCPLLP